MSTPLHFDFTVDSDARTIRVEREFNAPVPFVWAAWTTAELLDQWWAPKPWKTVTKVMDFRPGGHWSYAMVGPDGEEHLCRADYLRIDVEQSYDALDAFCKPDGSINTDMPQAAWNVVMQAQGDRTLVTVVTTYESREALEAVIAMGLKEGLTMALQNLDEIIAAR
jgi:uncharacterized protein YndB with AHSA1/START domain